MAEAVLVQARNSALNNILDITVPSFTAGSDMMIIAAISLGRRAASATTDRTISSVVFDTTLSLTSAEQQNNLNSMASRVAIYKAILTSGSGGVLRVTANNTANMQVQVYVVSGLDTAATLVTAKSNTLSDSVTCAGFIVDVVCNLANGSVASDHALTEGSGQTEGTSLPLVADDGTAFECNMSSSYRTGGSGSQTMAWTSPNTRASHVVVGFPRLSGGPTPAPTSMSSAGAASVTIAARARANVSLSAAALANTAITPRATARASLAGAGQASITFIARASAATALASSAAASVAITARVLALTAMSAAGAATTALAARASAGAALAISGAAAVTVAARATANASLGIAGASAMVIQLASDSDLTATPGRTFVAAGRARTYSRGGAARIFVLDTRRRTF